MSSTGPAVAGDSPTASPGVRHEALLSIAVTGALDASRTLSDWLGRRVCLNTEGFVRIPFRRALAGHGDDKPMVAVHTSHGGPFHGQALLVLSMASAHMLVGLLAGAPAQECASLTPRSRAALRETGGIVCRAFVNRWAAWLDLSCAPSETRVRVALPDSILASVIVEPAGGGGDVFMSKAEFRVDGAWLEWDLYLLPAPSSLRLIDAACG